MRLRVRTSESFITILQDVLQSGLIHKTKDIRSPRTSVSHNRTSPFIGQDCQVGHRRRGVPAPVMQRLVGNPAECFLY
jgi:hypothetical protein